MTTSAPDPAALLARIPGHVLEVVSVLERAGHRAVLVGGAVRDLLLGAWPDDYDVATSAVPEQVLALFPRTVATGLQHGTVTVVMPGPDGGHLMVEVTTFRTEGGYRDGRRPDQVTFVTEVQDDLSRRDFTINAIALGIHPEPRLVDPFDGAGDLERRVLRTVGEADRRFGEDGLRAVRAARFAATLGLEAAPGLVEAMARALPVARRVAVERVQQELHKLLSRAAAPSVGLQLLARSGLSALVDGAAFDAATLARVDAVPREEVTARWAAWMWDAGTARTRAALQALKASSALAVDASTLAGLPRAAALHGKPDADVRALVRSVGRARWPLARALLRADGGGEWVVRADQVLAAGYVESPAELALDGARISELTGARGADLGRLLRALVAEVDRDPMLNSAEPLAARARRLASSPP